MTIDPEMLMAYADGELGPIEAGRVEQAIAADPALAEQVERHRALSVSLRGAFAAIEQAPLPAGIAASLNESAKVVPLAPRSGRSERAFWLAAVAASLVAGFLAAPLLTARGGDLAIENGRTIARGDIARALDTQLAATQPGDATTLIGVTFRDRDNRLCRSFAQAATSGIACATGSEWRIERLYGGSATQAGEYRQAGSQTAAVMGDAQAMMAGEPMDAAQEAAAITARKR